MITLFKNHDNTKIIDLSDWRSLIFVQAINDNL